MTFISIYLNCGILARLHISRLEHSEEEGIMSRFYIFLPVRTLVVGFGTFKGSSLNIEYLWELKEGDCNALFVATAGFDLGHRGGHMALAALAGLQVMSAAPFPLSILPWYFALFCLPESLRTSQ